MKKVQSRQNDQNKDNAVYIISVAARLVSMHPQTLRLYEREGLIDPKRTPKKSRRYSEQDLQRLKEIQTLTQQHGVNLAGVRMIIELKNRMTHLEKVVGEMEKLNQDMEKEMQEEISRVRRSFSREVTVFKPGRLARK